MLRQRTWCSCCVNTWPISCFIVVKIGRSLLVFVFFRFERFTKEILEACDSLSTKKEPVTYWLGHFPWHDLRGGVSHEPATEARLSLLRGNQ